MDVRGLRQRRQSLVRRLRHVIGTGLERGRAQRRVEPRVREPSLVDQHLDIACMRCVDDWLQVVAQSVVRARSQHEQLRFGMLVDRFQDRFLRHRTEHAVLPVDRGIHVDGLRTRQHDAVMHRLMAVAIEQQCFAGCDQCLQDHLVGGRSAVGRKESALRAERVRRHLLCFGNHAGRLHQRIECLDRHR